MPFRHHLVSCCSFALHKLPAHAAQPFAYPLNLVLPFSASAIREMPLMYLCKAHARLLRHMQMQGQALDALPHQRCTLACTHLADAICRGARESGCLQARSAPSTAFCKPRLNVIAAGSRA